MVVLTTLTKGRERAKGRGREGEKRGKRARLGK